MPTQAIPQTYPLRSRCAAFVTRNVRFFLQFHRQNRPRWAHDCDGYRASSCPSRPPCVACKALEPPSAATTACNTNKTRNKTSAPILKPRDSSWDLLMPSVSTICVSKRPAYNCGIGLSLCTHRQGPRWYSLISTLHCPLLHLQNTQSFIVFNTKFIIFNTKSMIFNTHSTISIHNWSSRIHQLESKLPCSHRICPISPRNSYSPAAHRARSQTRAPKMGPNTTAFGAEL